MFRQAESEATGNIVKTEGDDAVDKVSVAHSEESVTITLMSPDDHCVDALFAFSGDIKPSCSQRRKFVIHNYSHTLTKLINSRHRSKARTHRSFVFSPGAKSTLPASQGQGNLTLLSATLDLEGFPFTCPGAKNPKNGRQCPAHRNRDLQASLLAPAPHHLRYWGFSLVLA